MSQIFCSVLFFNRPRSEGWPHHERRPTFSIYRCPLSFWLTLPQGVLSTYWCCSSSPAYAWHCSLHYLRYLFLQAALLFPHWSYMTMSGSFNMHVQSSSESLGAGSFETWVGCCNKENCSRQVWSERWRCRVTVVCVLESRWGLICLQRSWRMW